MADSPTTSPGLSQVKAALRERMRGVRRAIPAHRRDALGRRVAEQVASLPEVASARAVLVFSSFGTEIPTGAIVERLSAAGHRLLLPFVEGDRMEAGPAGPDIPLVPGAFGPLEPAARVAEDPRTI